jgi:tetratricopeptide (TPR) repeat protein
MVRRWPLVIMVWGALGAAALAQAPPSQDEDPAFEAARTALAADHPADAEAAIRPWIREHRLDASERMAEALVIYGDALTAEGYEYAAIVHYERVIKDFTSSKWFVAAVNRELEIGVRYVNGLKRMADGVRSVPSEDIGEELLIRVQERMPVTRMAERACLELADHYYRARQFDLAIEACDIFLRDYPGSAERQRVERRRMYARALRSLPKVLMYIVPGVVLLVVVLVGSRWMRRRRSVRSVGWRGWGGNPVPDHAHAGTPPVRTG